MFSFKAVFESVVEQGRRAVLQATRARVNGGGPHRQLKLSDKPLETGAGRGGGHHQHRPLQQRDIVVGAVDGGLVSYLRPVTARFVQGLVRRVSSPLWTEARRKSAKRLFGETAPYFALVGVTLVSGPERGLLTVHDELEALCGDIREAISRAGWIHNPNFWKPKQSQSDGDVTKHVFSLPDFDLGSVIDKGCNAVVYSARWKQETSKPEEEEKRSEDAASQTSLEQERLNSLQQSFGSGSLWTLDRIHELRKEDVTSSNFKGRDTGNFSKDDSHSVGDVCLSGNTSDSSLSDDDDPGIEPDQELNPHQGSLVNEIRRRTLSNIEALDLNGLDLSSDVPKGLYSGRAHNVSLCDDINVVLSTGGFPRLRQKRKKVKFKDADGNTDDEEEEKKVPRREDETTPPSGPTSTAEVSLEEYPLAVKMMFNYEIESNAPSILTAMYKEMLPARTVQLDGNLELWKQRFLNDKIKLPPHPNIVEMPCIFVDRVPLLEGGFSLYPEALPKRLNPSGYGRNMSLFCVMKRYDCTLAEYINRYEPSIRTSLLLLTQLLESILHINKYNVSHRDLKADNILLSLSDGYDSPLLVLSDFGCCLTDNSLKVPFASYDADPRLGNAALMAPEVKSATPGLLTYINYSRADLWAAGALAYETFGLPNPFVPTTNESRGFNSVLLESSTYKESQLPRLPKRIPAAMRHLIYDLLKRNPKQRPSPNVAATICQLSLWGPSKWLGRHSLSMPSHSEVMRWLLCLSTKVLCEAGSSSTSAESGQGSSKSSGGGANTSRGNQLEYEIVSTFLSRVHYSDIIQAIKFIRAF